MNQLQDPLMEAFTEMYKQYCRLKGYKIPKSPIEQLVDEVTGVETAHMNEFVLWLKTEILERWKLA